MTNDPQRIATATTGSALSALGMIESVRDTVHQIAGIWGDLGGMAITTLTLCYWVKLWRDKKH